MERGELIRTPRFGIIRIGDLYQTTREAVAHGYTEPTHYHRDGWTVRGKSLDPYRMIFAAVREGGRTL